MTAEQMAAMLGLSPDQIADPNFDWSSALGISSVTIGGNPADQESESDSEDPDAPALNAVNSQGQMTAEQMAAMLGMSPEQLAAISITSAPGPVNTNDLTDLGEVDVPAATGVQAGAPNQNVTNDQISQDTYAGLADQNAQAASMLGAVSTGLDNNAANQGAGNFGIGDIFGIGSAQAAEAPKGSMNLGDVRRGAEAAAARGTLDNYLAQDPRRAEVINDKSWLDNLFGSYMSNLQEKNKAAMDAKNISNTTSPINTPNVTLGYTAPTTGVQVGGSQNLVGQFTVGGPEAYRSGVSDPYGDYTPVGPVGQTLAPTAPATITVGKDFRTGLGDGSGFGTSDIAPTTPATITVGKDFRTGLGGGSGTSTADIAPTTPVPLSLPPLDGGGTDAGTGTTATDTGTGTTATDTGGGTTPTVDTTPAVLAASPAFRRKYLGGVDDPYNYGFRAEHQYYGSEPAAAKGGMFNADQYFADGGLVQPLSPPMVPLVSAQPTMAFTDGVGAVGSIAQPPGMYQSDAYGSDAPHASPMAPSVAAAVPSFQPGLATLATPNVNAGPVPSPIAQNPNVGYATGSSPLSNLTRS
jgi:hypothetical protein